MNKAKPTARVEEFPEKNESNLASSFADDQSNKHLQSDPAIIPACGIREFSSRAQGGAACARFHLLGAVCGDDVLPTRKGALATGDLQRAGGERREVEASRSAGSAESLYARVRQWSPALQIIREHLLCSVWAVLRASTAEGSEEVLSARKAVEYRFDHVDAVHGVVRLGQLHASQGSSETPSGAGSRRIFAEDGGDYGWKKERHPSRDGMELRAGHHAGDRSRLLPVWMVAETHAREGVFCVAAERQRTVRGGGESCGSRRRQDPGRRHHRSAGPETVWAGGALSARAVVGRGEKGDVGVRHQSFGDPGRDDHGTIPGTLADRVVFQEPEAATQDQNFRRHNGKRGADPDLDGADRNADREVFETAVEVRMELIELSGPATPAIVRTPVSLDMAGRTIPSPGGEPTADGVVARVIETAGAETRTKKNAEPTEKPHIFNNRREIRKLIWTAVPGPEGWDIAGVAVSIEDRLGQGRIFREQDALIAAHGARSLPPLLVA